MEKWIDTGQAVQLTGYNDEYLRWLARLGKITARKFGVAWQFDKKSLMAYKRRTKRGRPRKPLAKNPVRD